jgi:hypothetical protein
VCCDQVSEEHCYGPDNTSYCRRRLSMSQRPREVWCRP